jgi:LacI family transcriptional regulator, repressor for deo operon, udp, cdd, tsx, nupC, and nupG
MASIGDVARAAGVSNATVSRAMSGRGAVSDDAREKVRAAARALGYVASASAASLSTGRSVNIGILTPVINRWFFTEVIRGAQEELAHHGYDVTLYTLGTEMSQRTRMMDDFIRRGRVDAFIAIEVPLTPDEVRGLHALNKPVIGVGGAIPGVRTISIDDTEVVRIGMQHLLDLGHTSIGFIGGKDDDVDAFNVASTRRKTYESTLRQAGIPLLPGMMEFGDFTIPSGHVAAIKLLTSSNPPRAIIAASDEMAFGAIMAARELGISIPDELSIVGIDGHDLAEFFSLTTVDQNPVQQGRTAATILLDEILPHRSETIDINTAQPVTLVQRSSTARR